MPEAEQTDNGDYEMINEEHTFDAVNFNRHMLWKARDGHIRMGIRTIRTDTDEENIILSQGWNDDPELIATFAPPLSSSVPIC
ncbi:hypothetical protein DL95DRAFT_471804 [Leptodontidium sp. 2 PMI_412]|nr:hypothetical protein DL95DRAFT_471804 [Leptodontidium sp. 2 PMI_412]